MSGDLRERLAQAAKEGSTTAFTREQLAKLAYVAFYSPVLCGPQNIKAVVDEIDCCPGCDHVSNGGTCSVSERGDYCPNDLANTLRDISLALYGPRDPSHYVTSVFGPDQMPALRQSPSAAPVAVKDWVRCPICDEPDMRKETDADGNSLIHCVNHGCASNGGTPRPAIETPAVPEGKRPTLRELTAKAVSAVSELEELASLMETEADGMDMPWSVIARHEFWRLKAGQALRALQELPVPAASPTGGAS